MLDDLMKFLASTKGAGVTALIVPAGIRNATAGTIHRTEGEDCDCHCDCVCQCKCGAVQDSADAGTAREARRRLTDAVLEVQHGASIDAVASKHGVKEEALRGLVETFRVQGFFVICESEIRRVMVS